MNRPDREKNGPGRSVIQWGIEAGHPEEKKQEDVESEKTGSLERIWEKKEKRKRRQRLVEIGSGERKMGQHENLEEIHPSMGEI